MKDTKPPKESASSRAYRKAEATPVITAPALKELAETALAVLKRDGAKSEGGANPGDSTWRLATSTPEGVAFDISCTGPDLPTAVPAETAHPTIIPAERQWTGVYRLAVGAPLVALDIYWREDAPLRIMSFSRGDWEDGLRVMAG